MVSTRPLRCAVVALVATGAYAGLVLWLLPVAAPAASPGAGAHGLDAALVRASAVAAIAAGGWLWLGTAAVALAAARGCGERAVGLPAPLRRVALAACGVALSGALAVPVGIPVAGATPGRPHQDHAGPTAAVVDGLPLPDRPTAGPRIVVAAGDSLWSIAERELGAPASDAEIAQRWREIYAANRAAIGPDPDLIRPAQRLRIPPAHTRR